MHRRIDTTPLRRSDPPLELGGALRTAKVGCHSEAIRSDPARIALASSSAYFSTERASRWPV